MKKKLEKIKLIICDVDGVLTDGTMLYGNFGDIYRSFHVSDGMGIVLWHKAGLKSAIITSKSSRAVALRARELKIKYVLKNVKDKNKAFKYILKKTKLKAEEVCCIGDDLQDLGMLEYCGFSASLANACEEVKNRVDYIANKLPGQGAVREIIELILKAQNKWQPLVDSYATTKVK